MDTNIVLAPPPLYKVKKKETDETEIATNQAFACAFNTKGVGRMLLTGKRSSYFTFVCVDTVKFQRAARPAVEEK